MVTCTAKLVKSFVSQIWYNCYTCSTDTSTGVCVVCAQVCHAGHTIGDQDGNIGADHPNVVTIEDEEMGLFSCDCAIIGECKCTARFDQSDQQAATKSTWIRTEPSDSARSDITQLATTDRTVMISNRLEPNHEFDGASDIESESDSSCENSFIPSSVE